MFREESRRVVLRPWPKKDKEMQFTLTFRGQLPPEQRGVRDEKHLVRKQIHPQLRQWWREFRALQGYWREGNRHDPRTGIDRIADDFGTYGFRWVPLVRRDEECAACSLNFLLLVRQPPFGPFNGRGDLDNRIKTLIDGLCRPRQRQDLPNDAMPEADENPFFCLLEDDSLIFDFSVTLDRLLRPPQADEAHDDVEAVIKVKIQASDGGEPFVVTVG